MEKEKVEHFIKTTSFPIHIENTETPEQLVLYKGGEHVHTYDPVWSMRIEGDELVVVGFVHNKYTHRLSEFDELKVEPYEE